MWNKGDFFMLSNSKKAQNLVEVLLLLMVVTATSIYVMGLFNQQKTSLVALSSIKKTSSANVETTGKAGAKSSGVVFDPASPSSTTKSSSSSSSSSSSAVVSSTSSSSTSSDSSSNNNSEIVTLNSKNVTETTGALQNRGPNSGENNNSGLSKRVETSGIASTIISSLETNGARV